MDTRKLLVVAAALSLAAAGCAAKPTLRVDDAWVRPVEVGGTTAGYFSLVNGTAAPLVLVGVDAPAASQSQVHETVRVDGRATMREAGPLPVAPGATLRFEPGGNHVMLMGAVVALAAGDTTGLTLRFADGRTLHATAKVRQ